MQVVVEVEIESTIFSKHTEKQILLLNEYLCHQGKKRVKAEGVLALPEKTKPDSTPYLSCLACSREGHSIRVVEV